MSDLFEIREVLEADAARMAAQKATKEDIERIRDNVERSEQAVNQFEEGKADGETVFSAFSNCHLAIAQSTHNKFFVQFMDSIRQSAKSLHMIGYSNNPNLIANLREAAANHRSVYDAIAAHDSEKAYTLMQGHLFTFQEEIEGLKGSSTTV